MSKAYDSLKGTGLYSEDIRYDKRIHNENRDPVVTQILGYLNLDYLLDNMNIERFIQVQSYYCHVLVIIYALLIVMIVTREPGTINLSG